MSTKPVNRAPEKPARAAQLSMLPRKSSTVRGIARIVVICMLLTALPVLVAYAVMRLLFGPITVA